MIGIAGAGRIGQALGRLLRERGQPVAAVACRQREHAVAAAEFIGGGAKPVPYPELPSHAERVIIAVPDTAIGEVASILAASGMSAGMALHTCGALGPEALSALAENGVSCAALHPLQTIATPLQGVSALPGNAFAVSGEGAALTWAEEIVALLDGEALHIPPEKRAIYHAAAVMASNYSVGLVHAAVTLMNEAGIEEGQALRAIGPLVRASVANALALGPSIALTGPIERGDCETVSSHIKALDGAPKSIGEFYRAAGLHLVEMAKDKGSNDRSVELEAILRRHE